MSNFQIDVTIEHSLIQGFSYAVQAKTKNKLKNTLTFLYHINFKFKHE
jgi:hypothetical protein